MSYSQSQTGAYALMLGEYKGVRKLPIIIGGFEAQAIAMELEKMTPARPLTHDLFKNFAEHYSIHLKEVIIDQFNEGVFFAKLHCLQGDEESEIDARTSDAVALALRFRCPIYTYESVFKEAGVGKEDKITGIPEPEEEDKPEPHEKGEFSQYSVEELNEILEKSIEKEEYEKASRIRDEINRRKKK